MVRQVTCQEIRISTTSSRAAYAHARPVEPKLAKRRLAQSLSRKSSRKLTVRYSLLAINVILLIGVVSFVLRTPHSQAVSKVVASAASNDNGAVGSPLDQLSSADIAQSVATLTNLPEAVAVRNQAESVSAELASTPNQSAVASKPQIVATSLKSQKDIQKYTAQPGDSVSSLAAKFNVTSSSIKWSNSLVSDSLSAGQALTIPPVNGVVYTVKVGDTPQSLAQKFSANADQIIAFNDAEVSGLINGTQIVIPNGQQAAPPAAPSYVALPWGGPTYGFNGYDYGYCTWYVASQIAVPSNWGNASSWAYYAAQSGWTVSSTPIVGAIAQTPYAAGGEGHVAIVTAVSADGSQIQYKDMNGIAGWGRVGQSDWVSTSRYPHYIYH